MPKYYRFQNDAPKIGENVHCYTKKEDFLSFVRMMKGQDAHFGLMKFWEIEGQFILPDDEDAIVKVISVKQIKVTT